MSKDLQKWISNPPTTLETRIAEWRQRRGGELIIRREPPPVEDKHRIFRTQPNSVEPARSGEPIWLPRMCAVHAKGWVASYINMRGTYRLGETLRMTEHLWNQHKGNVLPRVVDILDLSREECAWCGATYRHWNSPVNCRDCGAKVCFGRTTADDYFHCCCGSQGQLQRTESQEIGFTPSLYRPGRAGR